MKIVGGPVEDIRPLNVGLMFFNDEPSEFFREAFIEVIDIPDPTGDGMIERKFSGPLDKQLSDALAYIRNTVIAERVLKDPNRAEATRVYNYPYPAIEEALSNAIYHKSYQIPEPITVRVENERLTITSFPGPDRSISDSDLMQHRLIARRYRNRRVGDFLKELHLVEGRNTGVPTMLRSLKDNGSALPLFETDTERSFFSVEFAIQSTFVGMGSPVVSASSKKRRTREQLEEEILNLLKTSPYSQNDIGRELGYLGVSKTLQKVIRELLNKGAIEYTTINERDPNAKLRLTSV
jgi:ATP-dependent DNA helicase RecG